MRTILQSGAIENPIRSVRDDDVTGSDVAAKHHADEGVFGKIHGVRSPVRRYQIKLRGIAVYVVGVLGQGILFVGDHGAVGRTGSTVRLKTHLPKASVSGKNSKADTLVAGCDHIRANFPGPVFTMADDEVCVMGQKQGRIFVDVHVGSVSDVISFTFQESDHWIFIAS